MTSPVVSSTGGGASPSDGIAPVFMTLSSQAIFHVRTGEDVTPENPMKHLAKADILADIGKRGVISDFYPIRAQIEAYTGQVLLLVYDAESIYNQNFYVCVTEEAMARVEEEMRLAKEQDEGQDVEGDGGEGEEVKGRGKGWASLGSEKEIEEANVVSTRSLLEVSVSRKRKEFGSLYRLGDRDAHDGLVECRHFRDPNYDLRRMEMDASVQSVAQLVDRGAQTLWHRPQNRIVQHEPILLSRDEQESVLESVELADFLRKVLPSFNMSLEQNVAVNVFRDDYMELADEETTLGNQSDSQLREYQSFTDLSGDTKVISGNQAVSAIDWRPGARGILAVSLVSCLSFYERVSFASKVPQSRILVWNFLDPVTPEMALISPTEIYAFAHCPAQSMMIVGGGESGQVICWDISEMNAEIEEKKTKRHMAPSGPPPLSSPLKKKQKEGEIGEEEEEGKSIPQCSPLWVSSIELSHRRAVTAVEFLPRGVEISAEGILQRRDESSQDAPQQFVTTGLDGQVLIWDLKLKQQSHPGKVVVQAPRCRVLLGVKAATGRSLTSIVLESEARGMEGLICGTEEGQVLSAGLRPRAGEEAAESTGQGPSAKVHRSAGSISKAFLGHDGPVHSVHRSPFFKDVLLSCDSAKFCIWREFCDDPLVYSPYSSTQYTCCEWSPTRPCVFFFGRADGHVEIWDLLYRSHGPSIVQPIGSGAAAITSMKFQMDHRRGRSTQWVAVGDKLGTLHVMDVPVSLARASANEHKYMEGFLERELRRVGHSKKRAEIRAKELAEKKKMEVKAKAEAERKLAAIEADAPPAANEAEARAIAEAAMEHAESLRAEAEYRAMEDAFRKQLGLTDALGEEEKVMVKQVSARDLARVRAEKAGGCGGMPRRQGAGGGRLKASQAI